MAAKGSMAAGSIGYFARSAVAPAPPLLFNCGALLRAIFSPVRQAVRFKVNPLIMLALIAKLGVVFGAKPKISPVIRQKQGSFRSVSRSGALGVTLSAAHRTAVGTG
jgi:hypothetical protein